MLRRWALHPTAPTTPRAVQTDVTLAVAPTTVDLASPSRSRACAACSPQWGAHTPAPPQRHERRGYPRKQSPETRFQSLLSTVTDYCSIKNKMS